MVDVRLVEVDADNWEACAALRVDEEDRRWVADVPYYLCLCAYGGTWHPLAIQIEDDVVGFLMWGVDDDLSRWIGGLVVDAAHQRRGVGWAAVIEAIRLLIAHPTARASRSAATRPTGPPVPSTPRSGSPIPARPLRMAPNSSAGSDWTTRRH